MASQQQEDGRRPADLHLRVLARIASGESYDDIAAAEYISSRTVRRLVRDLKLRAGVANFLALGAEATRRGWLA